MKNRKIMAEALVREVTAYYSVRIKDDSELIRLHLGRAHIISQYKWFNHFYVHFLMFEYAWSKKDWKEAFGQIVRMVATIPGHIFKRLPVGNTGWSNVPLRKKLPLPSDLEKLFDADIRTAK